MKNILNFLKNKHRIIFGPFVGEFGWEISRWNGFVRWYCKNNPNKEFVISTRYSSRDLYYNLGDNVQLDLFKIEEDYSEKFSPSGYFGGGENKHDVVNNLSIDLKERYKGYFLLFPKKYFNRENYDKIGKYDFDYELPEEVVAQTKSVLNSLQNKTLLCICARHRIDQVHRNWIRWNELFNMLEHSNKYHCIIIGTKNSTYFSTRKFHNIKYLFNEINDESPRVGITIDIMKKASLTIGQQSGNIILSNIIGTPTLFWGHEIKRHADDENYNNTFSFGIEDNSSDESPYYKTKPNVVFEQIERIITEASI